MTWTTRKRFEVEYSALVERKNDTEAPVPKLTKGMTVAKWLEYIKIHLILVIGKGGIPLYYVVHPESAVTAAPPVLLTNQAYSEKHGFLRTKLLHVLVTTSRYIV